MESKPAFPEALTSKLQRIGDLAEKLVYIKWSQEFFVLLLRAAQDILTLARPLPECHRITTLAGRLEEQIKAGLEKGELPRGAERERLMAVLDALCRAAPMGSARANEPETHRPIETITTPLFINSRRRGLSSSTGTPVFAPPALWLTAQEPMHDLGRKLEQRGGFQTRFFANLSKVRPLLEQSEKPAALIVDLDYAADQQTTFREIMELRSLLTPDIPLFFLADRGDITARIEAVKAGGAGYFTKPVDIPMLLEALDERVLKPLSQRVLIVDDQLPATREIARWLEIRGMATQVLAQPLQVLPALRHFQPNLLILSLDLKDLDGLSLAQAIRQHELFRELPVVLMSAQPETAQRLSATNLSGEALLGNPPNPELLSTAVAKRLRQGRGLHYKFSQLSHRDTVSGLYNRPYFLAYLERALVATYANAQSTAIMLITLDNLRSLESHDVAAADDVVEQAAKRLQTTLGTDAITARFSDAVFTVLLGFTGQEALPATAQAVQTALETDPYRLNNGNFELRTSIGISIAGPALREAAVLIQQADLACGMAREGKDTRIHVHHGRSVEQDTTSPQQRRLLDEIRESVQQQRMNLLFQPIVSLRGDTTERYEVLLRMRNHEGWEILPETVFSLVKRHRIGMVLDRWVIAHSIRVLRQRQKRGQSVVLFINISPTILQDEEFLHWLQGGLQKTGVPAASLVFEMTETTAEVYKPVLQPFLLELKKLGCGVSLDHFSGHEHSQALAQTLQADYIKLDARFTDDLLNNKARQEELTQLARTLSALGMTIIVTSIEDAMTLPVLWSSGINYVQGFFLQRPHTDMSYDFDQTVL
ncbi:MAG: EAL domain-containing protein [Candidatus Competibacteraceae bacterium]|nr:EAL domain-containing protein [Candidatus Competibacteraceae bacterium]MCP5125485.1 EAL domain-containing protein [Gammaproteobacteria bacterium]HRX69546.1 EAL domain-containing protein [Candidatus Competibacteraceae bacterium]